MKGHGAKFGRKKDEAILALLTQRNVEEAARSIGITGTTLLRWMTAPEFQTAYRNHPHGGLCADCRDAAYRSWVTKSDCIFRRLLIGRAKRNWNSKPRR
jgi:hypothetical protein